MTAPAMSHVPLAVAAQRLGVSWQVAWRLALQQKFQATQVHGRWYVDASSLDAYATARSAKSRSEP